MNRAEIRVLDKQSIRDYITQNEVYLKGKVLDYGCGDMPYKELVPGEYTGWDPKMSTPLPEGEFDAVLCTQVIQEVGSPWMMMRAINRKLKPGGYVVLTYNTHWEEYGFPDRWRFTKVGMEDLAKNSGFRVIDSSLRYSLPFEDFTLAIGYGIVLQK